MCWAGDQTCVPAPQRCHQSPCTTVGTPQLSPFWAKPQPLLSPGSSPPLSQASTHSFLQWAAVRTQWSSMRTPPQSSRTPWNKAVCQGCEWAWHSCPSSTLGSCALKCPAAGGRGLYHHPLGQCRGQEKPRQGQTDTHTHTQGHTRTHTKHTHALSCLPPGLHPLLHKYTRILGDARESSQAKSPSRAGVHRSLYTPVGICAPQQADSGLVFSRNMQQNLPRGSASTHPQESPWRLPHACFTSPHPQALSAAPPMPSSPLTC